MSAPALMQAVETALRAFLTDPDGKACGVQPDGQPPPNCGQWYYAIHWNGANQADRNPLSHDIAHTITVTITARMGYAPKDRRGARITMDAELIERAEAVAAPGVVHGNYEILNTANADIPGIGVSTNGFIEPLCLLGYGPVQFRGGDWVSSTSENPDTVLTCEVRFGQARRIQRF